MLNFARLTAQEYSIAGGNSRTVGSRQREGRVLPRSLAVITGASSGIGEVFARKLAPQYDLLLIARSKERLEVLAGELAAQHPCAIRVLEADLSDPTQLSAVMIRTSRQSPNRHREQCRLRLPRCLLGGRS